MKRILYLVLAFLGASALVLAIFPHKKQKVEFTFSHKSGFYDEPFYVTITAPTNEIYYTLDGSEPSKESLRYENSIFIDDASKNENVYSMRTDVSTGFFEEKIKMPALYKIPDYKIDKCTVLRAVYYNISGEPSEIKTASYFVSFDKKTGYDGMRIASLVTAPENLFDYEHGIYVTGKIFDDYFSNDNYFADEALNKADKEFWRPYWWFWNANYRQRGNIWERNATVQFFDSNKSRLLEQNCGIRIQGGGSRGNNPKSLALHARKRYGKKYFEHDFFDTGKNPQSLILFTGGDDSNTKMRDYLMARLTKKLNFATFTYKPVVLFLNGEYWGLYLLSEKYNEFFCRNKYGVYGKDVIMIKSGQLEVGTIKDIYYYNEMVDFISTADFSDPENYRKASELIDMQSFIDYFAAEIYISRNNDWPKSNFALWRTRTINGSSSYADKKWRWMLFDVNSGGMDASLVDFDSIESTKQNSAIFANLCTNAEFRQNFVATMNNLMQTVFTIENVNEHINFITAEMATAMKTHNRRFFGTEAEEKYINGVENIRTFFAERPSYMKILLEKHFS